MPKSNYNLNLPRVKGAQTASVNTNVEKTNDRERAAASVLERTSASVSTVKDQEKANQDRAAAIAAEREKANFIASQALRQSTKDTHNQIQRAKLAVEAKTAEKRDQSRYEIRGVYGDFTFTEVDKKLCELFGANDQKSSYMVTKIINNKRLAHEVSAQKDRTPNWEKFNDWANQALIASQAQSTTLPKLRRIQRKETPLAKSTPVTHIPHPPAKPDLARSDVAHIPHPPSTPNLSRSDEVLASEKKAQENFATSKTAQALPTELLATEQEESLPKNPLELLADQLEIPCQDHKKTDFLNKISQESHFRSAKTLASKLLGFEITLQDFDELERFYDKEMVCTFNFFLNKLQQKFYNQDSNDEISEEIKDLIRAVLQAFLAIEPIAQYIEIKPVNFYSILYNTLCENKTHQEIIEMLTNATGNLIPGPAIDSILDILEGLLQRTDLIKDIQISKITLNKLLNHPSIVMIAEILPKFGHIKEIPWKVFDKLISPETNFFEIKCAFDKNPDVLQDSELSPLAFVQQYQFNQLSTAMAEDYPEQTSISIETEESQSRALSPLFFPRIAGNSSPTLKPSHASSHFSSHANYDSQRATPMSTGSTHNLRQLSSRLGSFAAIRRQLSNRSKPSSNPDSHPPSQVPSFSMFHTEVASPKIVVSNYFDPEEPSTPNTSNSRIP